MDEIWKEIRHAAGKLRDSLGLPAKFFSELLAADDWSFVIKSHAFVETGLTWALGVHLKTQKLDQFVSKWDLAGGRSSKVECGIALGLLEPDDVRFIRGFSKIRNQVVHNIRHVDFNFTSYLQNLEDNERNDFVKNTCSIFYDETLLKAERDAEEKRILADPKAYLFWSTIHVIALLVTKVDIFLLEQRNEKTERDLLELQLKLAEQVLKKTRGTVRLPVDRSTRPALHERTSNQDAKPRPGQACRRGEKRRTMNTFQSYAVQLTLILVPVGLFLNPLVTPCTRRRAAS